MYLEFSKVNNAALGVIYDLYSFRIISKVGTRAIRKENLGMRCLAAAAILRLG
jgi:hypothetical protein